MHNKAQAKKPAKNSTYYADKENAASNLAWERPGADIAVLDNFEECRVASVICGGQLVTADRFGERRIVPPTGRNSVRARQISANDLGAPARSGSSSVIGVVPGRIITEHLQIDLPVADGRPQLDLSQDVLKVAVVERHGRNGNVGVGFVKGFGMQRGAIASTVGHDSHNICVVGADEMDMAMAANRLGEIEGGFVVVADGKVLAEISLPIAGLMSLDPYETVREKLVTLRQAALDLGTVLEEPFLQVAFLTLPVIPHLKITDFGVFDVDRFEHLAPAN